MIWYLSGLIILTILINKLTLHYGFKNLTYHMELDKRVVEIGEEIKISSIIENKKFLTVSFLKVYEHFPKGFINNSNIYNLFIMPYQRVKRTYNMTVEKRGLYIIDYIYLELGDFIGFKSEKKNMDIKEELIVLPEKIQLNESIVPIGSFSGDVSVKRWIIDDPLMTVGIREYTGNEPQKYIHWPSSKKYGSLMVKNFDFTSDNNVILILNLETMKPSWKPIEEDIIEKAISLTRTIMEEFEEMKIPYGFISNGYNRRSNSRKGYFYHPGLGQNHLNNLLEVLGELSYERIPSSFANTLKNIRRNQSSFTTAVIITPRILDTYIEPINYLNKTINRTVVVSVEEDNLEDLNQNIIKYRSN